METICICCPIGCRLKIEEKNGNIEVIGNSCPRGKEYGITEYRNPKRVLTTSIVFKDVTYTLKTTDTILKEKLKEGIKEIKNIEYGDYKVGEIIINNLLGLGANVVITGKFKNV